MIKLLLKNKRELTQQTLILLVSQILSMGLAILLDIFNTRILGKESFGIYSFINTFVFSLVLFFDFGIFSSGSRLLALVKDKDSEKSMMGLLFLITLIIGFVFSITIFFTGFFVDHIFGVKLHRELQLISFLVFIFPFQALIPMICRGSNLIAVLAVYNIAPKAIYILLIVLFMSQLNYLLSFILFCSAVIVSSVFILFFLKPNLKNCEENFSLLKNEVKSYGMKIYSGNLFGNISQYADRFLISLFMNTSALGAYSLAIRISSPLKLVSQSLSVAAFKEFTDSKSIDINIFKLNLILLIVSSVMLIAATPIMVNLFFGREYAEIIPVIPILVLGLFFTSLAQPINSFLGAKRKGTYVRNISIISPLINIALNCIFVPVFGLVGAAVSLVSGYSVSLVLHIYYYKKTIVELT
jgi:O-antigen/teichoic acid export membrane protein